MLSDSVNCALAQQSSFVGLIAGLFLGAKPCTLDLLRNRRVVVAT